MTVVRLKQDQIAVQPAPAPASRLTAAAAKRAVLAGLRRRLEELERGPLAAPGGARAPFALGIAALDAALPHGGLRAAALHEVCGEEAAALAFVAHLARRRARADGLVLWAGTTSGLYGPALAAFGLKPERLLLVRARNNDEVLWCLEEALKCSQLSAVVGEVRRLGLTASRRLQLAAESGGVTGLLWRPSGAQLSTSAAETRWQVRSAPGGGGLSGGPPIGARRLVAGLRLDVTLERCRGGAGGHWLLEWHDDDDDRNSAQAGAFHLAAPLADGSLRPRAAAAPGA